MIDSFLLEDMIRRREYKAIGNYLRVENDPVMHVFAEYFDKLPDATRLDEIHDMIDEIESKADAISALAGEAMEALQEVEC